MYSRVMHFRNHQSAQFFADKHGGKYMGWQETQTAFTIKRGDNAITRNDGGAFVVVWEEEKKNGNIFQVPVVQGTTSGLPNGCVWDNGRYFIEKQNRQYVVFDHGYFEVHSSKSKKDAIKWAEIKTATFGDDGGLL